MRRLSPFRCLIAGALMLGLAAPAMAGRARTGPLALVCNYAPAKHGGIALSRAEACARLRGGLATALRRPVALADGPPPRGDWLALRLEVRRPAALVAVLAGRAGQKGPLPGEIAVDASDRNLRPADLDSLAAAVARAIMP